jgi:cysteine desulfurase
MIYFDNAATTPLDPQVRDYMKTLLDEYFGNPSSIHALGRQSKVLIEESRIAVAENLGVNPSEIYFTGSATEGIATAIIGAAKDLKIKHIILSPTEHHAVIHAAELIQQWFGVELIFLNVSPEGHIFPEQVERILKEKSSSLVAVMHANNETGCLQPVLEISEICKKYDALFLSDMVQSWGKTPVDFAAVKPDFTVCSAHKFHGPKGIGFLYVSGDVKITNLIPGGGQERNLRSGTENIHGIAGLSKALDIAFAGLNQNMAHISSLKKSFTDQLKAWCPEMVFHANCDTQGLPNIVLLSFPNRYDTQMLTQMLDMKGMAISNGSACSSGVVSASHVLQAMGVKDNTAAFRFSFSKFNTQDEVNTCMEVLKSLLN